MQKYTIIKKATYKSITYSSYYFCEKCLESGMKLYSNDIIQVKAK